MSRAFSTLELLIAMTVLILTLGAVVLLAFSNQTILVDSETNAEALTLAQKVLEETQTLARKDFKLVNPVPAFVDPLYPMYTQKVDVETQDDYFSKKITATVSWTGEGMRNQKTTLTSIVSNFETPLGPTPVPLRFRVIGPTLILKTAPRSLRALQGTRAEHMLFLISMRILKNSMLP